MRRMPATFWWHLADVLLATVGLVGNVLMVRAARRRR